MKKGFTLIELLIVMVIVGTLVTVALPKYQASLERGRAQEAFANLKAASDFLNTQYVLNGNSYSGLRAKLLNNDGTFADRDEFTKSRFFSAPVWDRNDANPGDAHQIIIVVREGNEYWLTARNLAGELKEITCVATEDNLCEKIGMDLVDGVYKMTFTD